MQQTNPRIFGYARVSTREQHLDLQLKALADFGIDELVTEQVSGVSTKRVKWKALDAKLREGDTLVVWRLDRMGRSLQHLIKQMESFENRGVKFVSLTESINTTTAAGKLIFHIFGAFAEFERNLIAERTAAGVERAKARGKRPGRRFSHAPALMLEYIQLRTAGESVEQCKAKLKGLPSKQTLYRWWRLWGDRDESLMRHLKRVLPNGETK